MKTEEIQARFDRGYTMAIYGTRENIHEQMTNDIKMLLEAINYTCCCTELKDKPKLNFKDWYITFGYTKRFDDVFIKRGVKYSEYAVRSLYETEYLQNL